MILLPWAGDREAWKMHLLDLVDGMGGLPRLFFECGRELAVANYAIDHHWTRGQLTYACDELAKVGLTPCAAHFDWLATQGGSGA